MPRRTDLNHVLVIGSGPIVIGQACEFDYSGTQACRVLRAEGLQVSLVNSNPATIMTDPEFADNTYVEPITAAFVERVIAQQAERGNKIDALLATLGGQTALNTAVALLRERRAREVRRRADRRRLRGHPAWRGPAAVQGHRRQGRRRIRPQSECVSRWRRSARPSRTSGCRWWCGRAFTMGGLGSGMAVRVEDVERMAGDGLAASPTRERADRGIDLRLEGIRARADARPPRQRGGGVLDRELRPDGRAHRRLGHRRAGDDADRPRIPDDARPRHRDPARGRRRHRRLQHPVRHRSRSTAGWSSSR